MPTKPADIARLLAAAMGAFVFYGALSSAGVVDMRPSEPHPGLRDDALQNALRGDWKSEHKQLSYYQARKYLFKKIDGDGREADGAYTGETIDFYSQPLPNKGAMEHAWPLTRLPAEARTDLHHLYPVIPEARVARLNLRYGKVFVPAWSRGGSRSGPSNKAVPVFEVRDQYQGNIARSMFYVATMYDLDIPASEEKALRKWHDDDPVNRSERKRADAVAKYQSSSNPFVDHPGLVDRISDF